VNRALARGSIVLVIVAAVLAVVGIPRRTPSPRNAIAPAQSARPSVERLDSDKEAPPPDDEPATDAADISRDTSQADGAEKSVAKAYRLIRAGKLDEARAEIGRIAQLEPPPQQLAALQRKWDLRNGELSRERRLAEEAAALRREEQEWESRMAAALARGDFGAARALIDQWPGDGGTSARVHELRLRIAEAEVSARAYETAMSEKRYDDALAAVLRLEKSNPGDLRIVPMRERAQSKKTSARGFLTVLRLGDRGVLALDGKPVGRDGEVENESIPAGLHTLAVRGEAGRQATLTYEVVDGEKITLVYDGAVPSLRRMTESDGPSLARRRTAESEHRFVIEHRHGLLRGRCAGELVFGLDNVDYRPSAGAHGFRIPFGRLRLKTDTEDAELVFASDATRVISFRTSTPGDAAKLRQAWESLKKLAR